jgi:cytochrome c peroxidase
MKHNKLMKTSFILSALFATTAMASSDTSLLMKMKANGLVSIPAKQADVLKLTDPKGEITEKKVTLGKQLYFEPRLSKSGLISCNTCHNLGLGGTDGVSAAIGHKWTANPHHLNSPTVYNAVFFSQQFWDGRSPHLEDQAKGPIEAGPEMAAPKELVVERVVSLPEYVTAFKEAYGKEVKIDFATIASTIALFERTLVTPSRYDDFINGKNDALNAEEKEGLNLFIDKGCAGCHTGIALGGTMQPFQVAGKYKFADLGDFKGDANGMVKVPTLRNITETAPYFHNGAIWSLADAVKEMGTTQLGIQINDDEAQKIVTFLGTLKGRKPEITYPQLPESTLNTPQPDAQ